MQQPSACTNCGTNIPVEARFCRACGQRSARFDESSVTEETTRLLETPARPASFDQHVDEQAGPLAQATSHLPSQPKETSRSLQTKSKSPQWVLIGSLLVMAFMLTTLFIVFAKRQSKRAIVAPPAVTRPELPPIPPPPLPPRGSTEGTSINRALIYPGAETTMEVTDAEEGNVLQLRTSDSLDKVVDWYTAKLKPRKVVRMKKPAPQVILEADETNVVINENGDGTTIILTQGDD